MFVTVMPRAPGSEDGAVAVMVAALLPLVVLLLAFAIDASHWWVHKRHLQTQVDAGAFAGALGPWLPAVTCDDAVIEDNARKYASDRGIEIRPGISNRQYSNAENVHVLINARDPDGYEWNGGADYDTGTPCASLQAGNGHLDLKATESGLSNFFGSIPGFSELPWTSSLANAHARVEIRQFSSGSGLLPIAVPDPNPISGIATFVSAEDGRELTGCTDGSGSLTKCTVPLTRMATAGGLTTWDNSGNAATVPVGKDGNPLKVGVRIALSGTALCPSGSCTGESAAAASETCSKYLVECYELDTGNPPLHIRGYEDDPSGDVPQATDVVLSGCSNPYFSTDAAPCGSVVADAHLYLGGHDPANTTITANVSPSGCGPQGCAVSYLSADLWTSEPLNLSPESGLNSITFSYEVADGTVNGTPCGDGQQGRPKSCKGSFDSPLQWTFAAENGGGSSTGPIKVAEVWEGGSRANSVPKGYHSFVIELRITGTLKDASDASDPAVSLRIAKADQNEDPDKTQTIDCDPDYPNVREEIEFGCRPAYRLDRPPATDPPIDCSQLSWTGEGLQGQDQPWPCVGVTAGQVIGQVPQGMEARILQGGTCDQHPNNWDLAFTSGIPVGDTRVVPLLIVPFGTFSGTGLTGPGASRAVPVYDIGVFYVTGWSNGTNGRPVCPGDDALPPALCNKQKVNCKGWIMGHFIKYVPVIPGGGGIDPCNPEGFGACVAVLTD